MAETGNTRGRVGNHLSNQEMGLWLSRLERTPDKREVGGSSPLKPTSPKGPGREARGTEAKAYTKYKPTAERGSSDEAHHRANLENTK